MVEARTFGMYVNGEWVEAEGGERFSVRSPATGETLATFPRGTAEDLKAAVDAAVDAQAVVASLPLREREKLAVRIAEGIRQHAEEYARDLTLEHGKPIRDARVGVEDVAPNILWQLEDLKRLSGESLEGYSAAETWYTTRWEPLGRWGSSPPGTSPGSSRASSWSRRSWRGTAWSGSPPPTPPQRGPPHGVHSRGRGP